MLRLGFLSLVVPLFCYPVFMFSLHNVVLLIMSSLQFKCPSDLSSVYFAIHCIKLSSSFVEHNIKLSYTKNCLNGGSSEKFGGSRVGSNDR